MSLFKQIDTDYMAALKASNKAAVSTLRLVKSALKYKQIEKGEDLTDEDALSVLSSLVKQRRDSIEQYEKAGREDLAAVERGEIEVIQKYLPSQMSDEEVEALVRATIDELSASGPKDIGNVMKAVMPKVKGRADGKKVNGIVSKLLTSA